MIAKKATGLPPAAIFNFPKTIELEQRLARAELTITELRETVDVLRRHVVALQARLDHLIGKTDYC